MDRLSSSAAASLLPVALCAAAILLPGWSQAAPGKAERPDYMPAIRQELARLNIEASCDDTTGTCSFTKRIDEAGREFDVGIRYCRTTDTVYAYIERYLELTDPNGPSRALALRLLELNRRMVTAKLEWDRPTNSIRLSVVTNTDSNFDRRAFRSQLTGLLANAARLWSELSALAQAPPGQ